MFLLLRFVYVYVNLVKSNQHRDPASQFGRQDWSPRLSSALHTLAHTHTRKCTHTHVPHIRDSVCVCVCSEEADV